MVSYTDEGLGESATEHSSSAREAAVSGTGSAESSEDFRTVPVRGKVVWLSAALQRLFDIEVDLDARQTMVALETVDGQLMPIAKDSKGRGFHKDERLRDKELELVVRQFKGSPVLQVVRVYTLHEDSDGELDRFELDYWCDICAIPMFELKLCECCQGPTRLRERIVDEKTGLTTDRERNREPAKR